ncbi:MAG: hypothetical protein KGO92_10690, partial [Bacteroidota bacterium]|nr:hypothetical protein [Bacteroidota bacterium]
ASLIICNFQSMKDSWALLGSAQIDRSKWNECVYNHAQGLIYAHSDCLDAMSEHWHGLVLNDYAAIMPLTWKRKWGIRYLCTPPFLQQLGIIGRYKASSLPDLEKWIFQFCSYGDLTLNYANQLAAQSLQAKRKINLIIPLDQSPESIRDQYKPDARDSVNHAAKNAWQYSEGDIRESIEYYQQYYAGRMPHIGKDAFVNFTKLCLLLAENGQCITRNMTDINGNILATAVLLKDNKRIYNLMNTTLPEGRKKRANHLLMDRIMGEFANTPFLFDLEGSELPGVQQFYLSFGAVEQPYYTFHFNHLPWPLNRLKR